MRGRLTRVVVTDGPTSVHAYEAEGSRLLRSTPDETRLYFRDGGQQALVEYVREGASWVLDREYLRDAQGELGLVEHDAGSLRSPFGASGSAPGEIRERTIDRLLAIADHLSA